MEEDPEKSPPSVCPATVTVRRNPHRRARPTPSSTAPPPRKLPFSPSIQNDPISSFPTQEILSMPASTVRKPRKSPQSENLKVYLRIRPLTISAKVTGKQHEGKNVWPRGGRVKNLQKLKVKGGESVCVAAAEDSSSVVVTPPESLPESKRVKTEVYEGFSRVFSDDASQSEVYERMVCPLVADFLKGKSGMLAALGPSGSGKTHTVFGSVRDPGMVPLALRQIFSSEEGSSNSFRTYSLSMFEIRSEKGKTESLFDLLHEGREVFIQQSAIKGLEEVIINQVQQAESVIARGMLQRATAATNTNSQSSRSQCIINIGYEELHGEQGKATLTIVDLAGAEREKKTGNQGLRMAESNFINNTSMVFGLCLRSLLEHQKNRRKPLQKHFQNSLLTKYLRDYLEGKKRMALILTVKPGEDDYSETSNLLKLAAPFAQIKFANIEETPHPKCAKRPVQNIPNADSVKRMKFCASEKMNLATGSSGNQADQPQKQEICGIVKVDKDVKLKRLVAEGEEDPLSSEVNAGSTIKVDSIDLARREREHLIMANFNRALWTVLKEYRRKLEIAESEIFCLKDDLTCEKKKSSQLEGQLFQLKDLYSTCSSGDGVLDEVSIPSTSDAGNGTDFSEEQLEKKQENTSVPEILAEKNGESKDLHVVDVYLDNGATVSLVSQVDADNGFEEDGFDKSHSEIGRTGCLESATCTSDSCVDTREACTSSEEKESRISDVTASVAAICFPSPEKDTHHAEVIIQDFAAACFPSAEKESRISDVFLQNSPTSILTADKVSAVSHIVVPHSDASSPSAEKEHPMCDDILSDSDPCVLLTEKESADPCLAFPDLVACSPSAQEELSVSGINLLESSAIIPEAIFLDSPSCSSRAEKEHPMCDVILSDSDPCVLLTEKESADPCLAFPDLVACSPSAQEELSVSGINLLESSAIIPEAIFLDSPSCSSRAEKEHPMCDVILSDSDPCFLLTEKESADPYHAFPDSVACSPSAQEEILVSDVNLLESSAILPEAIFPDSPSCSSRAEKEHPMCDVILSNSDPCFLLTEKESADPYLAFPDSVVCSPSAQEELSVSGVILQDSPACSSREEIKKETPDVILLDSPACSSRAEIRSETPDVNLLKESEVSAVKVPEDHASSPAKVGQVPHELSENVVNPIKPENEVLVTEHSSPAAQVKPKARRRKLQPASSNLLKNIENLGAVDEIDHPKASKGGKASGTDTKNRSKGNTSLLRLLIR